MDVDGDFARMTRILVVDDERIIARDIQATLRELGYEVPEIAGTGLDAIAKAKALAPDLVIMDVRLAGDMDGIDAAVRIRRDRPVPIVFLTSYSDDETLTRAQEAQPYAFLVKPFTDRELRSSIELALYKFRSEERAHDHDRLLLATLESMDDALVATDETGDEAVGKPFERIVPLSDERTGDPLPPPTTEALTQRRAVRIRAGLALGEGSLRIPVSVCATPLGSESEPARGTVVLLHDATEERRREAQLALADRMAAVGVLSSGLAHEINNPLTFVLGNLEVLAEQFDPQGRGPTIKTEDLRTIVLDAWSGAERIRSIVAKLRRWGGGLHQNEALVDVRNAVGFALKVVDNELRHRARVVTHLDAVPLVSAREADLTQVFLSLLLNAIQAMPEDGGLGALRIATYTTGVNEAVVEVTDTGVGIAPNVLPRIFDPFFTTKARHVGTGLGLAICHDIVTRLGGRIEAESTLGVGSTFRVTIPAQGSARPTRPSSRKMLAVPAVSTPLVGRSRILVIDDEPAVAASMARLLSSEHDVVTANSGAEALARLARGDTFDVILCDVMMPGLSGLDVLDRLATQRPELLPRFIFMTGGAFTEKTRTFLEETPHLTLEKPIQGAALRAAINAVLAQLGSAPAPQP
jgi:CheY-like chemotaxis protein